MAELKPCPFCGGEAKVIKDGTLTDQSVIYSALCTCCRTQCYWFETKEETIEAWNTRAERTCNMVPNGEHGYAAVLACSSCGNTESVYAISADDFNYCPNCGAKVVEQMPTNEERLEVAARLRELDDHSWYDGMDEVDSLETAIGCSIGQDWQDQDWWERLADLIEPEPERTCRYESTNRCTWVCTSCGMEVEILNLGYNYCPNCGAKVVE